MRVLLSKRQQRQLNIIEILNESESWIHISEIAKAVKSSTRVILDDVRELKGLDDIFTLETSIDGIRISFLKNRSVQNYYSYILKNSPSFQILEYIFFNDSCTASQVSETLFLSVSTVRRLVAEINKGLFTRYKIQIELSPCHLVGDETEIRYFFSQYFSERMTCYEWPFDFSQRFLTDLIKFFADVVNITLDYPRINFCKIVTAVNIVRLRHGYKLNIKTQSKSIYDQLISHQNSNNVISEFEKEFNLSFDYDILADLFITFSKDDFIYSHDNFLEIIKISPYMKLSYVTLETGLDKIAKAYDLEITNKGSLIVDVHNAEHMRNIQINSSFLIHDYKKEFVKNMFDRYPRLTSGFYQMVISYRSTLNRPHDNSMITQLIYTLFTHWQGLRGQIQCKQLSVHIVTISSFDQYHAMFLRDSLQNIFGGIITAEAYDGLDIDAKTLSSLKCDFLVGNVNIPVELPFPYVLVNASPNIRNIKELYNVIDSFLKEKKADLPEVLNVPDLLK